jgi:hypothetical protein
MSIALVLSDLEQAAEKRNNDDNIRNKSRHTVGDLRELIVETCRIMPLHYIMTILNVSACEI